MASVWVLCEGKKDKCDTSKCDDVADLRYKVKDLFSSLNQVKPSDLVITVPDGKGCYVRVEADQPLTGGTLQFVTSKTPLVVSVDMPAAPSSTSTAAPAPPVTSPATLCTSSSTTTTSTTASSNVGGTTAAVAASAAPTHSVSITHAPFTLTQASSVVAFTQRSQQLRVHGTGY
ncbi:hypothetical protein Pelo_6437 [Pelomyxa schiedti]|nr:hypothetical protein Pelo_6437 [Pelomyxa schiedti]